MVRPEHGAGGAVQGRTEVLSAKNTGSGLARASGLRCRSQRPMRKDVAGWPCRRPLPVMSVASLAEKSA